MRILVDECVFKPLVDALQNAAHDVVWARQIAHGASDEEILALAYQDGRVIVTEDKDFGTLTIRLKRPCVGLIVIAFGMFQGSLVEIATAVTKTLNDLEETCYGSLTIIEPGRVRQRKLPDAPSPSDETDERQ